MKIYESGENYLEAIYMLLKQQENVRAVDISNFFGYSRPSVSSVVKKFKRNGFINVDENNLITLTDKGLEIAEKIYERHNTLAKFFIALGVSEKQAFSDACRVEHCLSEETYNCIKKHAVKYIK